MNNGRAIQAGERALESLKEAERQLKSAGNWGLLDLFGGRNISGIMKHIKLNNAKNTLETAKRDLWEFRQELSYLPEINIEVGGFLTFADFFFDGFLSDIFVQSKISKARDQVAEAISRTEAVLRDLRRTY